MTLIATDGQRLSNVLKNELWSDVSYCRQAVVVNDSARKIGPGTVLGKVTATGKYKVLEATASDGSQNFAGMVVSDYLGYSRDINIPATTDVTVVVLFRGPAAVADASLSYGASVDTDAEKKAVHAQMETAGIMVLKQL